MARYAWTTTWLIGAPIEPVWELIYHSERWPAWWHHFARVEEIAPGTRSGIGNSRRYTLNTRLPYSIAFEATTTCIERPRVLEAVVAGEVEGVGCWSLTAQDRVTAVRYDWQVRTNRRLFDLIAPLAGPLFKWNHYQLMLAGGRGLARQLAAPFLGMV